jgi:hypothetical protein
MASEFPKAVYRGDERTLVYVSNSILRDEALRAQMRYRDSHSSPTRSAGAARQPPR